MDKFIKVDVVGETKKEACVLKELSNQMINQFTVKNVAYGDSFGEQIKKYGPISGLVRISDKFSRIEALILGAQNKVTDERLEDTLMDAACYCLMMIYELQYRKEGEQDGNKE
jgi:hypothetical protein